MADSKAVLLQYLDILQNEVVHAIAREFLTPPDEFCGLIEELKEALRGDVRDIKPELLARAQKEVSFSHQLAWRNKFQEPHKPVHYWTNVAFDLGLSVA